jgi:hypothetical protein
MAELCPDCGVRQPGPEDPARAERATKCLWTGIALGALGILVLPIVLGPLAAVCGLLAMYYGRPLGGAGVVVWAVVASTIGILLALVGLALL